MKKINNIPISTWPESNMNDFSTVSDNKLYFEMNFTFKENITREESEVSIFKNTDPVIINIYCEIMVDDIKRFFVLFQLNTNIQGKSIKDVGDRCFNKYQDNSGFSLDSNPFRRAFRNVLIYRLIDGDEDYTDGSIHSMVITIVAYSEREGEERMII